MLGRGCEQEVLGSTGPFCRRINWGAAGPGVPLAGCPLGPTVLGTPSAAFFTAFLHSLCSMLPFLSPCCTVWFISTRGSVHRPPLLKILNQTGWCWDSQPHQGSPGQGLCCCLHLLGVLGSAGCGGCTMHRPSPCPPAPAAPGPESGPWFCVCHNHPSSFLARSGV